MNTVPANMVKLRKFGKYSAEFAKLANWVKIIAQVLPWVMEMDSIFSNTLSLIQRGTKLMGARWSSVPCFCVP